MIDRYRVEILPVDLDPLGAMHRTQASGDPIYERVDFFFACRRWRSVPRLVEPHKAAALHRFALDALPEPVVPHELAVLAALLSDALPPVMTFGFDQPNTSR